jgi:polyhydroxyalkanoate synthesis regulator phasin
MKKYKNLGFCNDLLKSLQRSNQLESETQSKLERARKKLNRLKRNGMASSEEVFEAVREVAEALYETLKGDK